MHEHSCISCEHQPSHRPSTCSTFANKLLSPSVVQLRFLFLRSFSFPKLWNNCMYLQPKTTAHTHSFVSPFFPNLIFFVVRERVTSSVIYTIFFVLCCCWCWVLSREWHSASTMRRRWRKSRLNNINRTMKRRRSSLCGEGFGLSRNQREKKESARRTWTCDAECIKFLVS